jgi:hypothetical protein
MSAKAATTSGEKKGTPSAMKLHRTVTEKTIEANRRNAKRSTGPQTNRGKRSGRFNAVTLGLFAKHVVIPICDGHGSDKEFQRLLDDLQQEFRPVGPFEEWLVVKIAESMWRLRRATRSENGSVRNAAIWDSCPPENDRVTDAFADELGVLESAEEQIRVTGTLTQGIYAQVLPMVEEERLSRAQSGAGDSPIDAKIDDEFLDCMRDRKHLVKQLVEGGWQFANQRYSDHLAYQALPPTEEMEKVLRYESRVQKQLDWALQRLLECQSRRAKNQGDA